MCMLERLVLCTLLTLAAPAAALAQNPRDMNPGDMRLVGSMDGPVRGLGVQPGAPQVRQATLVVANLSFADYGPPAPDKLLRIDTGDLLRVETNDPDE